jgi:hypothetical protein
MNNAIVCGLGMRLLSAAANASTHYRRRDGLAKAPLLVHAGLCIAQWGLSGNSTSARKLS